MLQLQSATQNVSQFSVTEVTVSVAVLVTATDNISGNATVCELMLHKYDT